MSIDVKMSDHFWLSEFVQSQTAIRFAIDNTPNETVMQNLKHLAKQMETVREALSNNPITISSGYRCQPLNAAIGGSKKSQHMTGEACDFVCRRFGTPYDICLELADNPAIGFDQLIHEGTWVHISFLSPVLPKPRREVLTWDPKQGYSSGLAVIRT